MPETYIAIMLQSLQKKEKVLDEIIRLDDVQKKVLTDNNCTVDEFDETVEAHIRTAIIEIMILAVVWCFPNVFDLNTATATTRVLYT